MVDAGEQRAEMLAVVDDAADRDAAEADAVIAALAADQAGAGAFAAHVVIGERDLERGVDRLGARVAEEHVVEIGGRERRDPARELEGLRMGELERRRVVELRRLALDRRDDRVAVVAGIAAPHAGGGVEHGAAVGGVVVHVLGPGDQPRRLLEGAVGRERHPERFEIVGPVSAARRAWDIWNLRGRHSAVTAVAGSRRLPMADYATLLRAERASRPRGRAVVLSPRYGTTRRLRWKSMMARKRPKPIKSRIKSRRPVNRPKARLPRGLADRGPAEIAATRAMLETIRKVYELYGFEPVETPAFEYTDALGKFLPDQDRPNEGVFSFQDDDEQWLSLRYDLTAPLARYVAENFDQLPKPYRSYRAGWVFRNEKPGPGRFRQFMQFDADTVGSASMAADAEICMMAADTMEALGIPRGSYVVKVNNRKLLDGAMESIGLAVTAMRKNGSRCCGRSINWTD